MTVLVFPHGRIKKQSASAEASEPALADSEASLPSRSHRHQRRVEVTPQDRRPRVPRTIDLETSPNSEECPGATIAEALGIPLDQIRAGGKQKTPALRLCREGERREGEPASLDQEALPKSRGDIVRPIIQPVIDVARQLLTHQEFVVFHARFILEEPISLAEVGAALGITEHTAEQLEASALRRMMRGRTQN